MSTLTIQEVPRETMAAQWEANRELIKRTVAPGLTDDEFALFIHVCKARSLDPLQKQIYAIKRKVYEQGEQVLKMVMQVSIEGFRSIANRTGLYMPSERLPLIEGTNSKDLKATVWVKKWSNNDLQWHEFGYSGYYREFVQTRRDSGGTEVPVAMWAKMPTAQLIKCCEAAALRKGWPEELGGIYAPEEVANEPQAAATPPTPLERDRARRELGTLKPSAVANRGHGNEGMVVDRLVAVADKAPVTPNVAPPPPPPPPPSMTLTEELEAESAPVAEAEAPKLSREDAWLKYPGYDAKKHINFKQGMLLWSICKRVDWSSTELATMLADEFDIPSVNLIPWRKFQDVLDRVDPDFKEHKRDPKKEAF
jgi:phage recombination protein Bet